MYFSSGNITARSGFFVLFVLSTQKLYAYNYDLSKLK